MDLSIVIPLHNEEESVGLLCEAIVAAVQPLEYQFETILVDDGSTDQTFRRACEQASEDTRFRVIKLKKNFGQTAALSAGFEYAEGEIIATMDGDLQNDPEDIDRMVRKIQEGYDVVVGYRADRKDRFFSRKLPSRIANWFIRKVMGTSIRDNGCAIRAYRADVIKRFTLYSEMHRLLPTILVLAGAEIAQVSVRHHPRKYGKSKYGIGRVYKVLVDLLVLKMVLTAARLPLFGFGAVALLFGAGGVITLLAGLSYLASQSGGTIVVHLGASMLLGALSLSLLMLGVLTTLIYAEADFRVEDILEVKAV